MSQGYDTTLRGQGKQTSILPDRQQPHSPSFRMRSLSAQAAFQGLSTGQVTQAVPGQELSLSQFSLDRMYHSILMDTFSI